jgi:hypothetical protein
MLNYSANAPASTGYNLTRSLRFRASASAHLNRTPAGAGDRQKFTYSGWIKRGNLVGVSVNTLVSTNEASAPWAAINLEGNQIQVSFTAGIAPGTFTNAVFRDPSAWYHIVVAVDTTQATAANRIKIYVNNVLQSILSSNYPAQNANTQFNDTVIHKIGGYSGTYFDGYMAELNWIDGQALTPASFGSTNALTGVWQPARYTGTYGTNGFYLPFTDNSTAAALGTDFSGNSNTWTVNNISVTAGVTYDSMTDVPTLTNATTANYAVLNPLANGGGTLAGGNLNLTGASAAWGTRLSTIAVSSGKFYAEITPTSGSSTQGIMFGISNYITAPSSFLGAASTSYGYYGADGALKNNGLDTPAWGATVADNDVVGIALDMDAGTLALYKNNVQQGSTITGLSGLFYIGVSCYGTATASANFGQRPFAYTPPTGFLALNTFNLPTDTILKGNTVMDATLYTGNGSTQTITNAAGFQPDLVWMKGRSGATDHALYDSVRGVQNQLESNTTTAETAEATGLTAFGSGGFTVGALAQVNTSAATYVGWQWKAGGAAASNTDGTITSSVSANASAGFSVVTYNGTGANATVGHGLGVAPSMVIVKARESANAWRVGHKDLTSWAFNLQLNGTAAQASNTTLFNSTAPTSTVFSVGTSVTTNESAKGMVAYCWSEIDGFSKFGSYTGNGSTNGPFVYTGFRPRWVMWKSSSAGGSWSITDTDRSPINVTNLVLRANFSDAEISSGTGAIVDFLSNGFKFRNTGADHNTSGATYIYMAFAENPFKNSLAR